MNNRKAFTLIELLVVVSIIALLVSILLPSLSKAREQAKRVVCASNQHQIIIGLQSYQVDYGKLPPSIQGVESGGYISWTLPLRLSYGVPQSNTNFLGMNGASVGKQLADYLPAVVWGCPCTRVFQDEYQEEYAGGLPIDPEMAPYPPNWGYLNSSYWLLWNYDGWEQFGYTGAGAKSQNKVLLGDFLLWNNGVWLNQKWGSSHRMKGSTQEGDRAGGYWWKKQDPLHEEEPDLTLNAGYIDGHVETYRFEEAHHLTVIATDTHFYLPPLVY